MNRKHSSPDRGTVLRVVIGLLGAAICCAGVVAGLTAYRDHVDAGPTAQVRATAPPAAGSPAAVSTSRSPASATTPAPAAPPATPTARPTPAGGTYWVCQADVDAAGAVEHSLDAGIESRGGVISPVCQRALEIEGILKQGSGGQAFQVPVGHFVPFDFCGITVANIVNVVPGNIDVPPSRWIAVDYQLFSADWSQGAPSGTC